MLGLDGDVAIGSCTPRRNDDTAMALPLCFRQQCDEGGIEICRAGLRQQIIGCASGKHMPGIHGDQPVEAHRLLHIRGRDNDAHTLMVAPDIVDQRPELPPRQRVDAGRRLVEDEQIGVVDQRTAEPELLLHAAGELARRPVRERRQARAPQEVGDAALALPSVVAEELAEEIDVLEDGERRIEVLAEPLRHVGDPRIRRLAMLLVGDVATEHRNTAVLDSARTGHQRQEARLADTVRPDEANHAAGRQVERDRV